jgi:hypothetical protein
MEAASIQECLRKAVRLAIAMGEKNPETREDLRHIAHVAVWVGAKSFKPSLSTFNKQVMAEVRKALSSYTERRQPHPRAIRLLSNAGTDAGAAADLCDLMRFSCAAMSAGEWEAMGRLYRDWQMDLIRACLR